MATHEEPPSPPPLCSLSTELARKALESAAKGSGTPAFGGPHRAAPPVLPRGLLALDRPPGSGPWASSPTTCIGPPCWPRLLGSPLLPAWAWHAAGAPSQVYQGRVPQNRLHRGPASTSPDPSGPGGQRPQVPQPQPPASLSVPSGSPQPLSLPPAAAQASAARNQREHACLCQLRRKQNSLWFVTQIFCLFFQNITKLKTAPSPPPPRQTETICLHWPQNIPGLPARPSPPGRALSTERWKGSQGLVRGRQEGSGCW